MVINDLLIHVGNGHYVNPQRILAISPPHVAASRRAIAQARLDGMLLDFRSGKKCMGIIILDTGMVIKVALRPRDIESSMTHNKSNE